MPEKFTVHCVIVYRRKKAPNDYMMTTCTLAGDDLSARMKTIVTVDANCWVEKLELVNFSHAFLPFEVGYQI